MNRPKRLYTIRQVAEIAGVSIRTIRRWIDRGKLPTRQPSGPGGVHLIDLEDLYKQAKNPDLNNGQEIQFYQFKEWIEKILIKKKL